MYLNDATVATLQELEKAKWFSRVGQPFTNEGKIELPVVIVPSWKDAMNYCSADEWGLVLNESTNLFTEKLRKESVEEFQTWNDRVADVKKVSVPLVKRKIEAVQREHNLPEIFELTVHAQISMVLMEAEYAHVIEPENFAKLAFWFVNGHFPCGWKGEFPNGNLVIY